MVAVNGWYEGGGGMSVQSIWILYGEMGKEFSPDVIQPLLENIDRRDGSKDLIPAFHRKGRFSPPAVALILGCPLRPRRVERGITFLGPYRFI